MIKEQPRRSLFQTSGLLMKKHIPTILISLLIAAIWGYFSDLRHGEWGWFIGRLIFIPCVVLLLAQHAPKNRNSVDKQ